MGDGPHLLEQLAVDLIEAPLPAQSDKLGNRSDTNVDWVDGHRRDRRVRRLLARRPFVQWQKLQDPDSGRGQPPGNRLKVANLTDSPAGRRRAGEEGDEQARTPSGVT